MDSVGVLSREMVNNCYIRPSGGVGGGMAFDLAQKIVKSFYTPK